MKRVLMLLVVAVLTTVSMRGQVADTIRHEVLLQTNMGDIRIALSNETPKHRDNFMKLVKRGYYNGLTFYRVIKEFMIQTGMESTRKLSPKQKPVNINTNYTVPAERCYPHLFHKKGAVAMAREDLDKNPTRASSSTQFYIVCGWKYHDAWLDDIQKKMDETWGGEYKMTPEIRDTYKTLGGSAHLDCEYTVFGEVIEGLDVVEKIENLPVDDKKCPIDDVRIIKASVVK